MAGRNYRAPCLRQGRIPSLRLRAGLTSQAAPADAHTKEARDGDPCGDVSPLVDHHPKAGARSARRERVRIEIEVNEVVINVGDLQGGEQRLAAVEEHGRGRSKVDDVL